MVSFSTFRDSAGDSRVRVDIGVAFPEGCGAENEVPVQNPEVVDAPNAVADAAPS
jgi:hypothetical protein